MRRRAKLRKCGGSLAIVIAADVVKSKGLREGAQVEYDVVPVELRVSDIAGMFRNLFTDEELRAMYAELEHGWDD